MSMLRSVRPLRALVCSATRSPRPARPPLLLTALRNNCVVACACMPFSQDAKGQSALLLAVNSHMFVVTQKLVGYGAHADGEHCRVFCCCIRACCCCFILTCSPSVSVAFVAFDAHTRVGLVFVLPYAQTSFQCCRSRVPSCAVTCRRTPKRLASRSDLGWIGSGSVMTPPASGAFCTNR